MKIVTVVQFGGPDVLKISDAPIPTPGPREVAIAVEAIGVGYVDVMARQGSYGPVGQPGFIPGAEVAGKIIACGKDVEAEWLGRRVFAICGTGGYAERIAVDADSVVALPDGVSSAQAVSLGVNALVAWFALERARANDGKSVLVRGASGGIGLMATQIGAYKGAVISAITSSSERGQRLHEYGATHILNRKLGEERDATGYDIIIDTVGGQDIPSFMLKLNANGHYVLCGGAADSPPGDFGQAMLEQFHRSPSFSCFSLNSTVPAVWRPAIAQIFQIAHDGHIKPAVDAILNLDEASEAHRLIEAGQVFGKLVLAP